MRGEDASNAARNRLFSQERSRVCSHVDPENGPARAIDEEDVIWDEIPGRDGKKIHGSDTFSVNGEELLPSGSGRPGWALAHVFAHRIERYAISEPANFTENSFWSPAGIFRSHSLNQSDGLRRDPGVAGCASPGYPAPEELEQRPVELDQRSRPDNETHIYSTFPEARERSQEQTIAVFQTDSFVSPVVYSQLQEQVRILENK